MAQVAWFVLITALGLLASIEQAGAEVLGNSRAAELDQCVEPTEFMRRYHMELLLHQRDETVHQGIRTKRHSLVECIACHAEKGSDGQFVSINAEGQFCQDCHATAAVSMDCFQCHATKPDAKAQLTGLAIAMTGPNCQP